MNRYAIWLTRSATRAYSVVALAFIALALLVTLTLGLWLYGLFQRAAQVEAVRPGPTQSAEPSPWPTVEGSGSVAKGVVEAYFAGNTDAMASYAVPGLLEQLLEAPAAPGRTIRGEPILLSGGRTMQAWGVPVDTTVAQVRLVLLDGVWMADELTLG